MIWGKKKKKKGDPHHGILYSNKKGIGYWYNNLDESPGNYIKWRNFIPPSYIYDSIFIAFFRRWNRRIENRSVLRIKDRDERDVDVFIKEQHEGFLW